MDNYPKNAHLSTEKGEKPLFLKNRKTLISLVLIITFLTFIFCFYSIAKVSVESLSESKIKVVLDAGHGGVDGGVSGVKSKVKESELNLKVAFLLQKRFIAGGYEVIMTRESSAGLYGLAVGNLKKKDMEARRKIIEKSAPAIVISIHMNKFSSSSRRGAQVFYKKNSAEGKNLAEMIQYKLNGLDEWKRDYSALMGDYYILNSHTYPACIVECGFLSNEEDEKLLLTESFREKLADSIYDGAISFLTEQTFMQGETI